MHVCFKYNLCGDLSAAPRCHEAMQRLCDSVMTHIDLQRERASLCVQADGTEKKMGAYLMKTCFQTTCISSAMFITAMAANPLAVDLAKDALGTTISWGQWALAGVPHTC